MKHTKIQWTERTWNPVRGCSRVSKGCEHCYADTVAHRFGGPGQPYEGLTVVNQSTGEPRWNGTVKLVEDHLLDPLRWQKPSMIFVNSMSDVFHEAVPDEYIDRMFAVMALAPQHTFQILTKRPERMYEYFTHHVRSKERWPTTTEKYPAIGYALGIISDISTGHVGKKNSFKLTGAAQDRIEKGGWPLPNVWLGVSVEDQKTADERIPILLKTPAAVRWISAEPLLGALDLTDIDYERTCRIDSLRGEHGVFRPLQGKTSQLDWVVVGGESGPKARPFNLDWARDIVMQCKDAGVACFVKQLGARAFHEEIVFDTDRCIDGVPKHYPIELADRKGGNIEEWPQDLRVREYPNTQTVAA
jgi:protein gp37